VRGGIADELLAAVEEGRRADPPAAPRSNDDLDRTLRPAVTLVSAWVSQVARVERIDTTLLATRTDIIALLCNDPEARLGRGWRADLVGADIRRLVEGRAALTFQGEDGLVLTDVAT
jgi:ribonuclease D